MALVVKRYEICGNILLNHFRHTLRRMTGAHQQDLLVVVIFHLKSNKHYPLTENVFVFGYNDNRIARSALRRASEISKCYRKFRNFKLEYSCSTISEDDLRIIATETYPMPILQKYWGELEISFNTEPKT